MFETILQSKGGPELYHYWRNIVNEKQKQLESISIENILKKDIVNDAIAKKNNDTDDFKDVHLKPKRSKLFCRNFG